MRPEACLSPSGGYGASSWPTGSRKSINGLSGIYGKRRIRDELLDMCEMSVNHTVVSAITIELDIPGFPRPGRRKPNLLGVETLADRNNRDFTVNRPNESCFPDIINGVSLPGRKGLLPSNLHCFSKLIVNRSFPATVDTALANNAVHIAAQEWVRSGTTILAGRSRSRFTSRGFGENLRRRCPIEPFGTVGDCILTGQSTPTHTRNRQANNQTLDSTTTSGLHLSYDESADAASGSRHRNRLNIVRAQRRQRPTVQRIPRLPRRSEVLATHPARLRLRPAHLLSLARERDHRPRVGDHRNRA